MLMTGLELTMGSPLRPQVTLRGACNAAPIEGCFVPRCVNFGYHMFAPERGGVRKYYASRAIPTQRIEYVLSMFCLISVLFNAV